MQTVSRNYETALELGAVPSDIDSRSKKFHYNVHVRTIEYIRTKSFKNFSTIIIALRPSGSFQGGSGC
jgi:hypothetical protein